MASTEILELRDRSSDENFKIRENRNCCLQQRCQTALLVHQILLLLEVIDVFLNNLDQSPVFTA